MNLHNRIHQYEYEDLKRIWNNFRYHSKAVFMYVCIYERWTNNTATLYLLSTHAGEPTLCLPREV